MTGVAVNDRCQPDDKIGDQAVYLVGVTGFEPVAPRSQSHSGPSVLGCRRPPCAL